MRSLLRFHIDLKNHKTRSRFVVILVISLALGSSLQADLKRVRAEPNFEKRSRLALENALAAYQHARAAYESGDNERLAATITEIQESVNLAYTSLKTSGKNPRKSPKWFKWAEIETGSLLRKLERFQQMMSFSDRALLDSVKATVQQVHDDLLLEMMRGK